ncbi:MAG: mechanosensitive ion channel, partial [Salinibacterium sp.]|nr:mechanosensitive ion channel [Salinibacterium sp.]
LLSSLPIPTILWWLGWVLLRPVDQVSVAVGLGEGFQHAAFLLLPLTFVKRMCRKGGLADAHFRWPAEPVRFTRRHLRWFIPVAVPTTAFVVAFDHYATDTANAGLGRLAFSALMAAVATMLAILARPSGPIVTEVLGREEGGWIDRLRFIWYPAIILIPVTLTLLTWVGYYYTALQFEIRFEITTGVVLTLLIVNGVLMRWLFLARRRVAVEDARRRREQAINEANSESKAAESKPTEAALQPLDEDKVNLPGLSTQTRQLFRSALWVTAAVGLYITWADVLPALRMLDRVEILPTPRIVEAAQNNSIEIFELNQTPATDSTSTQGAQAGANRPQAAQTPTPSANPVSAMTGGTDSTDDAGNDENPPPIITLADFGLAVVILIATYIAFRNLPGLIEIAVLQRLPLDAGSRYALSTVLRYIIAFIGIVSALGAVNIGWSNIQWLAAALTFGLAFGLQEIFANF